MRSGLGRLPWQPCAHYGRLPPAWERPGVVGDEVATRLLADVHEPVGTVQQLVERLVRTSHCDPGRDGHPDLLLTGLDPGVLHEHPQPLRADLQPFVGGAGQDRQKLLPAPADGVVRAAQAIRQALSDHPQHRVAGGMSVFIIDRLEVVDIDEDETQTGHTAAHRSYHGFDLRQGVATVPQIRQRIDIGVLLALARRDLREPGRRPAVEHLHRPDDRAVRVPDGAALHGDRHPVTLLVVQIHLSVAGLPVLHDTGQGTPGQTQLMAALADMTEDPLGARVIQDFVGRVPGDVFGARVPVGDTPVTIDEVDPVLHLLEDGPIDLLLHWPSNPDPPTRRLSPGRRPERAEGLRPGLRTRTATNRVWL